MVVVSVYFISELISFVQVGKLFSLCFEVH
jgi:hypothetical protein